jgi:hypothetical protein
MISDILLSNTPSNGSIGYHYNLILPVLIESLPATIIKSKEGRR